MCNDWMLKSFKLAYISLIRNNFRQLCLAEHIGVRISTRFSFTFGFSSVASLPFSFCLSHNLWVIIMHLLAICCSITSYWIKCILTWLPRFYFLQKRDDARQFMKFLHPDLGVGNVMCFFSLALNWTASIYCWIVLLLRLEKLCSLKS